MELKEGMYIRTKDGFIDKVINDYKGCCDSPNCNCKHVAVSIIIMMKKILLKVVIILST